eukprot:snap_masked-scaffold_14-processed-gene-0.26-mRNA-1 protein AED:1.00 eAED:1.00 QI:0/-1/0/0/-1/1/1/0/184
MSFCNGADCCNLCCNDLASSGRVLFDNCFLGCEDDSCGEDDDCLVGVNFVNPDNQPFDFNGASICCTSLGERLAGEDCNSISAPTDGDDGEETSSPTTGDGETFSPTVKSEEYNYLLTLMMGVLIGALLIVILFLLIAKRKKEKVFQAVNVGNLVERENGILVLNMEGVEKKEAIISARRLVKE